jgi:DNA-binding transcriptional LysR family regulator
MDSTIRDAATQHWVGKALSLSNERWLKRAHGAASNRDRSTPVDLAGEQIIHTRRESDFFRNLSNAFVDMNIPLSTLVETRQFTAACELVSHGVGVAVVSELDAIKFSRDKIQSRPFLPTIPHRLSLVRPTLKHPSAVTLEFIDAFAASLAPFRV